MLAAALEPLMHAQSMDIIDYNGEGKWAKDEILSRYAEYCKELDIHEPLDIRPQELIQQTKKWIYPVMDKVIEGIEKGDRACIWTGIEFIEENNKFPFGKTLKSNTARALRRAALTPGEQERIREDGWLKCSWPTMSLMNTSNMPSC